MPSDPSPPAPRRSTAALASLAALLSLGLALAGCGDGSGEKVVAGDSPTQDVANDSADKPANTADGETATPVAGSSIEFRPVLSVSEPGSTVTTVTGMASESGAAGDSEGALAASDPVSGVNYLLGPVVIDSTQIDSATFRQGRPGEWLVDLVIAEGPDGIDRFNALAQKCYDSTPECRDLGNGKGQIAIVLDGDVISAPTINVPSFERDQIQVGVFDAESAKALAEAINRS